jgi:hypothetical protein
MAVALIEKSYEWIVNELLDPAMGEQDQNAFVFWNMKEKLTNWTSNPWTVAGSGDASAGAMDSVDRWVDYTTDLTWQRFGVPRSWIVLEHPNGQQILIDCWANADTRRDYIHFAFSGEGLFTGGSATACPTAVDGVELLPGGEVTPGSLSPWFDSAGPRAMYAHFIHATDGSADHMIICYNGVPFFYWAMCDVADRVDNYTLPGVAFGVSNSNVAASRMSYAIHTEQGYWGGKSNASGSAAGVFRFGLTNLVMGTTGNDLGQLVPGMNSIAQQYALYPVGIMSLTAGLEGRHGRLPDMWMAPSSLSTGDSIEEDPANPTYELVVFGNIILPWNGTVPVVA